MNWFVRFLKKIFTIFTSPKAQAALETAAHLSELAFPIVETVSKLTPNRTLTEVVAAYKTYGQPLNQSVLTGDPTVLSNALLNLATEVLRKELPADKAVISTNILNTAVQLAVTAMKAK